jgi:hypothetical protein
VPRWRATRDEAVQQGVGGHAIRHQVRRRQCYGMVPPDIGVGGLLLRTGHDEHRPGYVDNLRDRTGFL